MAREEFLLHGGEDTIHDPNRMKVEMDPKKKRENFWFYYKWHVIIGTFIVLLAVWTIHDVVSKVNPDYTIGFITTKTYSSDALTKLEKELAVKGKDLNGDGQVVVSVSAYNVAATDDTSADPTMQQAAVTKMAGDLQTGESMIFIVDDYNLKRYQAESPIFAYADGSTPADGATDYENMGIKWSKLPFLSSLDLTVTSNTLTGDGSTTDMQPYFSDLNVCLRVYQGTWLESKKGMPEYYAACKELADSFKTN